MTSFTSRWPETITRWIVGDPAAAGPLPIAPTSVEALAQVLADCAEEGWRVAVQGNGGWSPPSSAADIILSTRRLNGEELISPQDLVATVGAGASAPAFQRRLLDRDVWLPLDPPGTERTIGSIMATATAGGLAAGFGAVREHVLGMTVVTGDGRILRPGGRVVKNVAGFDLSRLVTGAFGAYGVITTLHLKVRTRPERDTTVLVSGDRDHLFAAVDALRNESVPVDAIALVGRDARWCLAVRLTGSPARVGVALRQLEPLGGRPISTERAEDWWAEQAEGALTAPTTVRIGAVHASLPDAVSLAVGMKPAHVAAYFGANVVRIATDATADQLADLRATTRERGMTCTLERMPEALAAQLGHYTEPASELVGTCDRLRRTFDPHHVFTTPLFPA